MADVMLERAFSVQPGFFSRIVILSGSGGERSSRNPEVGGSILTPVHGQDTESQDAPGGQTGTLHAADVKHKTIYQM